MKGGGYGPSQGSRSGLKESSPGRKSGLNNNYSNSQPFEVNEAPLREVKQSAPASNAGGDIQVGSHL